MSDCLFCRIAAGEIPANVAYQDDDVIAFHDISPQAPLHVLVIPRKHIATINDIEAADAELVGKLYLVAKQVAADAGHSDYRVVMNCGADAGQSVFHIHLHVLAGRQLSWPPG